MDKIFEWALSTSLGYVALVFLRWMERYLKFWDVLPKSVLSYKSLACIARHGRQTCYLYNMCQYKVLSKIFQSNKYYKGNIIGKSWVIYENISKGYKSIKVRKLIFKNLNVNHTGGKWFTHNRKHRKESQLLSPEYKWRWLNRWKDHTRSFKSIHHPLFWCHNISHKYAHSCVSHCFVVLILSSFIVQCFTHIHWIAFFDNGEINFPYVR